MTNKIRLKKYPQPVTYELYERYSPVSMECFDGKLISNDEYGSNQRENLLKLLIFNIGIERTMEIINENKTTDFDDWFEKAADKQYKDKIFGRAKELLKKGHSVNDVKSIFDLTEEEVKMALKEINENR